MDQCNKMMIYFIIISLRTRKAVDKRENPVKMKLFKSCATIQNNINLLEKGC